MTASEVTVSSAARSARGFQVHEASTTTRTGTGSRKRADHIAQAVPTGMTSASMFSRNGLPGTASARDTSRSDPVATTIRPRPRWDGGRATVRSAWPVSSTLSSRFAATLPGCCPASVAVLDQNSTTISVMNTAKIRPSDRSSPAWCTASAGWSGPTATPPWLRTLQCTG